MSDSAGGTGSSNVVSEPGGDETAAAEPVLLLSKLRLRRGPLLVQPSVSLHVGPGEVVAIVGRNGVGKTTLAHCLAGWIDAAAGSIRFRGNDITSWSATRRCRSGLAVVPDSRELYWSMTVKENLTLAWRYGGRRAVSWEEFQGQIETTFPSLPQLYRRRCHSLSGGQQQLVTIARALATNPSLLVMDEPTFGLSPSITGEVLEHIESLQSSGLSVLLCEQSIDVAMDCASAGYVMSTGTCGARLPADQLLDAMYQGMTGQPAEPT